MECVCACVYLEPIIQRKISYNNALYMDSRKMVLMSPFSGQQWRRRHREQTCGHSGGRTGWDELREEHGNMHVTICKTDGQRALAA